ncbi:hypothetical protein MSAN_00752800 [Mycena sanguinolenta]|uniref:Uncharacterized protein n=1 Tax=Mycena sanguinolenta TaxID=230812 RepID=A0A8H7DGB1_9AGAR|nr:hypothetical protein MSAN_00752800 [Mycena sanguinolenta]
MLTTVFEAEVGVPCFSSLPAIPMPLSRVLRKCLKPFRKSRGKVALSLRENVQGDPQVHSRTDTTASGSTCIDFASHSPPTRPESPAGQDASSLVPGEHAFAAAEIDSTCDIPNKVEKYESASRAIPTNSAMPSIDSDGNIFNHTIEHVSIVHVAGNRNETHFYSAVADPTAAAPLPEDFRKNIENNPRLRSILGVAMVFHDPPSALQISVILGLRWNEVGAALRPISSYLEPPNSAINLNTDIKLRQALKDSLLRRAGTVWIDAAKYHALIAEWCLVGQSRNACDVIYAGEFWDYHVCNASPSSQLYDALRSSRLPLNPVSRTKLPPVIHWLNENGGAEAVDLLLTYGERSSDPSQPVQVMGGALSMLF